MKLIDPNPDVAYAYTRKAEEALEALRTNTLKDWRIATAYYAFYYSLYSLVMRTGIRCEIHSCSIELAGMFLSKADIRFLRMSLKARIDSQ